MRSMTGYGRGESRQDGTKFTVELSAVNRKQSDVTVTLPRELAELEPRIRDVINTQVARGRLTVVVAYHGKNGTHQPAIDVELARNYYRAMSVLQKELGAKGEIGIETVLRAPGVLRDPQETVAPDEVWPQIEKALKDALLDLIKMREREGRHLAKDLIHRLKVVRQALRKIRQLHPDVVRKLRDALRERIQRAGIDLPVEDERLVKEVIFFADKSDISEELTRLDSHLAQFAHHLRKDEPVGRTLDFMTQEIYREFNTLGSKANDAGISQLVVLCKSEMEKVREQIQNIE